MFVACPRLNSHTNCSRSLNRVLNGVLILRLKVGLGVLRGMPHSRSRSRPVLGAVWRRRTLSRTRLNRQLPSLRLIAAVTLILASMATAGIYVGMQLPIPPQLYRFGSYADLAQFVRNHHPPATLDWLYGEATILASGLGQGQWRGTAGYSTTNVQVEGVDEPDYIKTDGTYLYTVRNDDVLVIRAYPPNEAAAVATLRPDGQPQDLFIYNSMRLVVIGHTYTVDEYGWRRWTGVAIEVFDVSQPDRPQASQHVALAGEYLGARLIGEHLYLVVNSEVQNSSDQVALPAVEVGGTTSIIPADVIYYDPGAYDYRFVYTLAIALNIADPAAVPEIETFLGGSGGTTIYASLSNLYIGVSQYASRRSDVSTAIHRFSVIEGSIDYVGSGQVGGYLVNQFALDEYDGNLRVATTSWVPAPPELVSPMIWSRTGLTRVNNVYVLDLYLNVVGRLEGLAPGEWIYSVRFLGDTGYLVTFLKTDPLFVVDLSVPRSPRLLGELEVTGYSDYLHPLGDHQLLGIGKDAVPAGETWWWYQGVKLSLFDTMNPCAPMERARLVLGVRGTDSEALRDHKAVLVDPARQLLVIPVLLAEYDESVTNPAPPEYGRYVSQGAFIFHLDHIAANLTLRGVVSHLVEGSDLNHWSWEAQPFFVTRSLYIGDILYTLSRYKLAFNDLATLTPIGEIILSPGFAAT